MVTIKIISICIYLLFLHHHHHHHHHYHHCHRHLSVCTCIDICCCSVAKSSLTLGRPLELQHVRFPCPSLSPRVCSNSYPLNWYCYLTISSSVTPFSCLRSFPASGSFPMSQLSASGGQSTGVSASASVLLVNMQGWFPLGFWLVWSSCCWRDSQESSPTPQLESINSSALSLLYGPTLTSKHDYWKNLMRSDTKHQAWCAYYLQK